jgi:ligand-binding sensor domain-containing protein
MKKKLLFSVAALSFLFISAFNPLQAQWLQTSGPTGGNVNQIAFNSISDAFIATNGGVFSRLAGTTTWIHASSGITTNDVRALINVNDVLWAGGYEVSGSPGGVFLSSDKGVSWAAMNSGITNRTIISLGNNSNTIFAGTNGAGIFRTTNAGVNWTPVNSGLSGLSLTVNTIYTMGTTIYAGTNEGLAVSSNNGANWTVSTNGLPVPSSKRIFGVTIQGSTLFVGSANGVYKSIDGGSTFTSTTNDLTSVTINHIVSDATYLFLATQGGGVFRSSNNGANWTAFNNLLPNNITTTLRIAGNLLFCGTQGDGIFYSFTSSPGWINVPGLINTTPKCFTIKENNLFTGLFVKGVSVTSNSGGNWTYVNTGLTSLNVNSIINDGTNLYVATASGAYKSVNNGTNWTNIGSTFGPSPYLASILKVGGDLFVGTLLDGVYYSPNEGVNWSALNDGIPPGSAIWNLKNDGNTIYAAAGINGIYKRAIGDPSWTAVNNGLTGADLREIFISGSTILAGYSGLFATTDQGGSWTSIATGPLAGKTIRSIYALENGGKLLIGTYNYGIYASTNGGTEFTAVSTGLPALTEVNAISLLDADVFIALTGHGVWKRPLAEMIVGIKTITSEIPAGYKLEQNYPNPFNPETNIKFALPKNGKVMLTVYDITGKEISALVNGFLNAGTYEYNFSAKTLTSGIYIYKLTAGNFTAVKKMILLK